MNEVDDCYVTLKAMVNKAKHILNNPPFKEYISQGAIRATYDGEGVEFVSKDKLREKRYWAK